MPTSNNLPASATDSLSRGLRALRDAALSLEHAASEERQVRAGRAALGGSAEAAAMARSLGRLLADQYGIILDDGKGDPLRGVGDLAPASGAVRDGADAR